MTDTENEPRAGRECDEPDLTIDSGRVSELLSFLPYLRGLVGKKAVKWRGGEKLEDGTSVLPYPDYPRKLFDFFRVAAKPWWTDPHYLESRPGKWIEREMGSVGKDRVLAALTFCVRGERFCNGYWAEVVESGRLVRVLERIGELWLGKEPP